MFIRLKHEVKRFGIKKYHTDDLEKGNSQHSLLRRILLVVCVVSLLYCSTAFLAFNVVAPASPKQRVRPAIFDRVIQVDADTQIHMFEPVPSTTTTAHAHIRSGGQDPTTPPPRNDDPPPSPDLVIANPTDLYRPLYHYSVEKGWANDPNGLVYHNGVYHLFYQFYPLGKVWGDMHWGHAVSRDLLHWEDRPIALFPDQHGYIFSGSAVVDHHNTMGLTNLQPGVPAIVAVFTYHSLEAGQTQGLAYSVDSGVTWTKYEGNPVLVDHNEPDFRDPKVFWHEPTREWVMVLSSGGHVRLYSSTDLKLWKLRSKFRPHIKSIKSIKDTTSVKFECPDLFPIVVTNERGTTANETVWVMVSSLTRGPNGGVGTLYLIGDFNGKEFNPFQTQPRWLDVGPDNYAAVSFSNMPNGRIVMMGWFNNWMYADKIPADQFRGTFTLPRELSVKVTKSGEYTLYQRPASEFDKIVQECSLAQHDHVELHQPLSLSSYANKLKISLQATTKNRFWIKISSDDNEWVEVGFDPELNAIVVNRDHLDTTAQFVRNGVGSPVAVRSLPRQAKVQLDIYVDHTNLEVFVDGGRTVMSVLIFSNSELHHVDLLPDLQFSTPTIVSHLRVQEVYGTRILRQGEERV